MCYPFHWPFCLYNRINQAMDMESHLYLINRRILVVIYHMYGILCHCTAHQGSFRELGDRISK